VGDGTSDARREALAGLGATVLAVDAVMAQILEKDDQLPRLHTVTKKTVQMFRKFPPQVTPLPTAATYTLLHLFLNTVICVL
ncbi:hypothetical protein BKA62DRAFT_711119, partial [Auriculariales sp. MPI-PUGE-AT-0066]